MFAHPLIQLNHKKANTIQGMSKHDASTVLSLWKLDFLFCSGVLI